MAPMGGNGISRASLLRAGAAVLATGASGLLLGCSRDDTSAPSRTPGASATRSPSAPPSATSSPSPSAAPTSVPGFAAQTHRGDRLKIRSTRERGNGWTSHDVTWRVRSTGPGAATEPLRLSGVLTLPDGPGPHPVVVLAHGYIDPAVYRSGQGMTRERQWLGARGWASLHVDYRGHAGSDPDPTMGLDVRLGYAADVISAVGALRDSDVVVDPDRVVLMGRSMGGGVVQKVAEIAPDVAAAVAAWAAVSSLEAENVEQFMPEGDPRRRMVLDAVGSPEDEPEFWEGVSARAWFDRVAAPVLLVHGRNDDVCPPRWARETYAAMQDAGVDVTLEWFGEGHTFDADFEPAMRRTLKFFRHHT